MKKPMNYSVLNLARRSARENECEQLLACSRSGGCTGCPYYYPILDQVSGVSTEQSSTIS
jgi:hypothetical protein